MGQVMIAQDVCTRHHYTRYGGKGYAHILNEIVPRMRTKGFAEAEIEAILVDNPRRALTFVEGYRHRTSRLSRDFPYQIVATLIDGASAMPPTAVGVYRRTGVWDKPARRSHDL